MAESLNYILDLIDKSNHIELDGGGAEYFNIVSYDVMPNDFLKFAEDELKLETIKSKINIVSNLKRAIDCQIDIFLDSLYLKRIFDKNNLKFEQKTKFLADIGLLSIKSINKLNSVRNKMEHEYTNPFIEDLQVYYDLVWYVTEIIQTKLLLILTNNIKNYNIYVGDEKYHVIVVYEVKNREFLITIKDFTKYRIEEKQIDINISLKSKSDIDNFVQVFKFYLLTLSFDGLMDEEKYKDNIRKMIS